MPWDKVGIPTVETVSKSQIIMLVIMHLLLYNEVPLGFVTDEGFIVRCSMRVGFLRLERKPDAVARSLFALANLYGVEFFYFTPEKINMEKRCINGLFFEKGDFVEKTTDYPEIVDDHHIFMKRYPGLYDDLSSKSFLIFTPLGGKLKINNIIQKSTQRKYLIETDLYKDINIDDLLKKQKTLVIKPNRGNKGKNIYKISMNNGLYCLQLNDTSISLTRNEFEEQYAQEFSKNYIIQSYVDSATNSGNSLNVRVLSLRGKNGKWIKPKITPRVSSINRVAASLSSGGTVAYSSFLSLEYGDNYKKINSELMDIGCNMPDIIQKAFPKLIDSFGFDVGIDRANGYECKLFEANTYPAARPFEYEVSEAKIHYYIYLLNNYHKVKYTV